MTYNAGIEYINLKDAKYNRDKRMIKTGVKISGISIGKHRQNSSCSFVAEHRCFRKQK